MKTRMLLVCIIVTGSFFLFALTAAIQDTPEEDIGKVSATLEIISSDIDPYQNPNSNGLIYTSEITFTPVCTVYLPGVLKNAGPPSSAPVLNSISNPDEDGEYTVSWSTVDEATSYVLEEDDNAAFSSPTTAYSGNSTSASIAGKSIGTYYYRVKAMNSFGSSDWSNTRWVEVTVESTTCEPGHYAGTRSVSFDVTQNQEVCDFTIRVPFGSTTCRINPTSCAQITDNSFRFEWYYPDFGITDYVNGTCDTSTHVTGDWKVTLCGNSMVFPPSTGTWEADKE